MKGFKDMGRLGIEFVLEKRRVCFAVVVKTFWEDSPKVVGFGWTRENGFVPA